MIRPNMATMLGFVATDASDRPEAAATGDDLCRRAYLQLRDRRWRHFDQRCLYPGSDRPVAVRRKSARSDSPEFKLFLDAVTEVAMFLAQALVRDGEGATKFITIQIEGGMNETECRKVGYAIAHSPLVKTAFFASDPNLGRILAAIGYAGIDDLDVSKVDLYLDDVMVAKGGGRAPSYREEDGQRVMKQQEITGARRAQPRGLRCDGVDLRSLPRLRQHQRRLPQLIAARTHGRPGKIDSSAPNRCWNASRPTLPPKPSAPDWKASTGLSLAQAQRHAGFLQPVAHPHKIRLIRSAGDRRADRTGRTEHPPVHRRPHRQQCAADGCARHRQILAGEGGAQQVFGRKACA